MAENRNKLAVSYAHFLTHMKSLVGLTGEDSELSIQKVAEGESGIGAHPIPHVLIQFLDAVPVARVDKDLVWTCRIKLKIVTRAVGADGATSELLTKLAVVQNQVQSYQPPPGVDGFDKCAWALSYPIDTSGPAYIQADSIFEFTVAITTGAN